MKKSLIVSFMITALIYASATPRVSAQNCSTPGVFREAMQQLTKECKKLGTFGDLVACVSDPKIYPQVLALWNKIANNGPLTVGPREAVYNQVQHGSVQSQGDRRFLAAPSDKPSVTLSVKKVEGKSKLLLSICKVDGNGNPTLLDTFTFQSDAPAGQEYKKTFSGVLGHGFDIFLDGRGGLTKFEFDLKLSK
jgi:hypothetical protein